MDEPQNPKKPVDELLKDLYGPSDDLGTGQAAGQPVDQSPEPIPASPSIVEPALTDLPSLKPSEDTNLWPPVPPTPGVDKNKPPWEEPVEPPVNQEPALAEPLASETNYPKPPVFQTSVVGEPAGDSFFKPSVSESVDTTVNQMENQTAVPTETVPSSAPPPEFTSPLPPRPEPEIVTPIGSGNPVAPPPGSAPVKKSKRVLILPFIAVLMIGLAALLFVKSSRKIAPSGPVNLTYWGLFEPNSVFRQVIADYGKDNPKVKINYQQQSGLKEYRERLSAALTKAGGPDIFRIHLSWAPMFFDSLSVIPSSVYSVADFDKDYYPSASTGLKTSRGLVGLPIYFDSLALFYNEDLFRAAGQNPPSTWEDLLKSACTLTVRDQNGRVKTGGVAIGSPANVDHWPDILGLMLLQNDADPAKPDACNERAVCPGQDALTFFTSFVKNSACRNTEGAFLGSSWSDLLPSSTYAFATGQVAMYFAPSWRVFDIKNLNPHLNFKIVPVPQLTTEVKDQVAWATYWVESVSANSPNQTEAWKFLKYLSSKETLEKLYLAQTNLGNPRIFGEPYPRVEMASMLTNDPWVGPFIFQAPFAKNWFLSSFTNDNGVNDSIIKYYEDAVNQSISGQTSAESLKTVTQGVAQILSRYGVQATAR